MGSPPLLAFSRPKKQRLIKYVILITATLFILTTIWDSVVGPSPRIQYYGFKYRKRCHLTQPARQKAVRKEFLHAWYGYKDHSWMADSLMSLSGRRKDQFCGWSATLVDTLDTLWIMDLKEEFDEAVDAVVTIDFLHTANHCEINLFESTIRYLGGMLAAYDLSGEERLLPKLIELGDILYGQFRTTNGMPCNTCYLIKADDQKQEPVHNVPLADAGSFYLELARLSQITGDQKYLDLVDFLTDVFESTQNSSSLPGLWPERVDAASINGSSATFAKSNYVYSLGAFSDSAYEYLVKAHLLLGGLTDRYADMWIKAADAIQTNLLFRAYIPQWNETDVLFSGLATHLPNSEQIVLEPRIEHLGCFAGGMFALSSRLFNSPSHLEIGKQLTEGCIWAYDTAPLGIMPETVTLLNCPNITSLTQCPWNETTWHDAREAPGNWFVKGYPLGQLSSTDTKYLLRPEAIESVFILYRITGDNYYRDVGWEMFTRIIAQTRTAYGHAALLDVMNPQSTREPPAFLQNIKDQVVLTDNGKRITTRKMAAQHDEMESFWLAETLKYFWLLFSEPTLISLDEWVLNTEAHPLRLGASRAF